MSDTTFGDFEVDDAFDHEPPAPEQVAYKLHALRREIDVLAAGAELPAFDDLEPEAQQLALGIGEVIVAFIVERNPDVPEDVARHLHEARRYMASSRLPPWEELPADDRQVGIALMALIIEWLRRQGALA